MAPIVSVAGVDTSSSKIHVWCNNGYHAHRTIKANSKNEPGPDDRRQQLHQTAVDIFSNLPVGTLVACEEPIALKNGKTTRLLGLSAGAIWAAHLAYSLFWVWVDIAAWKKEVCGHGGIDKAGIREWALENLNMTATESVVDLDREPDYYDAACICRYGEIKTGIV